MEPNSVDAIITDPPYGINYQSHQRKASNRMAKIQNDKTPFIWWLYDAYRVLKDGDGGSSGVLICFTRWDVQQTFIDAMHLAGFSVKSEVVWYKMAHGAGDCKAQFAPSHENILFAVKGKFQFPAKRPNDVLSVRKVSSDKLVHPNEKPVELLESLILSVTQPGSIVLDPFAGSGPTLIAAEQTGRDFIGIEIESQHCGTIRERFIKAGKEVEIIEQ
jgi:site-specific DNA-methyltransferase (adenine-specific)